MSARGWVAVLMVAVWVLLGPIAMTFSGCAWMGTMCEGPCGAGACAIVAPTLSSAPAPASSVDVAFDLALPATAPARLEHPPKSLLRSA